MKYKVIVAHPERQHSFRLASALKKNGMLCKYVTTVYNKKSSLCMQLTKLFLSKENLERANKRINPDLQDDDVIQYCELLGLIQIALYRFDKSRRLYNWWHKKTSKIFGKKVAKLAIRENADAVILYDANALTCFNYLKENAPHIKRIMDVSAANRLFMKKIYETDMNQAPFFARRLRKEREFLWRSDYCELLQKELSVTQYFLSPSDFVRKSLLYSNIDDSQIKICPYGSNFEISPNNNAQHSSDRPLKAVYVGNVTQMKGIYYLLESSLLLPKEKIEFTVVGDYKNDDGLFNKYLSRVKFTGRVTHNIVHQLLKSSDIFVFPSLGEGMSLAVLEAMSCGLPCIVSKNSGVERLIENKKNGFIVDHHDVNAIVESLKWFIENKSKLFIMRQNVINTIQNYSWDKYEVLVSSIIQSIIKQ